MRTDPLSARKAPIEFRNVTIRFDDRVVLDRISFRLDEGEMICVTGDSQSG